MFRLTSLDHIVLRVVDVERSMDFYTTVLGCSVEHINDEIGLYQLRAGDCIIDLVDVAGVLGQEGGPPPGPTAHNVDHFCVRIEPFDEADLRRHFADHGIEAGRLYNNWGADGRGPSDIRQGSRRQYRRAQGPPDSAVRPGYRLHRSPVGAVIQGRSVPPQELLFSCVGVLSFLDDPAHAGRRHRADRRSRDNDR